MSSSITKFNKNNKCCPRCNHYILNNIIQCKTITDNYLCDYIFPHKDIDEKLRILKNESSLIKKFNRETQSIKVPKTPVKAKQSIKVPKTPVKAKQSKVPKTPVKAKQSKVPKPPVKANQSIKKKKYNQINEKKKECPRCKKYVYNATKYCKKLINGNLCGYMFPHKSIDEDVRNKKNNLSIQKKGVQKGIQKKGVQKKGVQKKVSKKQCPKCNLLTFPATKSCKHIINNKICGYIFKKCKYTNKKKVSNKIKLGDDYLYEIKIDNSYMGNIKLDDKYIDEIKLDDSYLKNSNETRLDNKFIDEIKSIRKQLFKETWKDNTFNNLSDIESL
jgi:hypothetical protein